MFQIATILPWLPLLVAVIGIGGVYWNNRVSAVQKAKLEFVNEQLRCLYGPLYSLNYAANTAWNRFREQYRPNGSYFVDGEPLTDAELDAWIRWMRVVFMPINEKMFDVIVARSELIEGDEMPTSFLDFLAHVAAYRVVLDRWADEDLSEYTSLLNYPEAFRVDVNEGFRRLRAKQRKLHQEGAPRT